MATRNKGHIQLTAAAKEDVTKRYEELYTHYGLIPTRNNRGKGHENGGVESPHGHLKNRIRQTLLLRNSVDFESVLAYQQWVDIIVKGINTRNADEAYLGTTHFITLPKKFSQNNNRRTRCVDYRHIIGSLERKPQAFRYSQLRDDLLPNETYRLIWEGLDHGLDLRAACKTIVGILSLASRTDREAELGDYILGKMKDNHIPALHELQKKFDKKEGRIPQIDVMVASGEDYNMLLSSYSSTEVF